MIFMFPSHFLYCWGLTTSIIHVNVDIPFQVDLPCLAACAFNKEKAPEGAFFGHCEHLRFQLKHQRQLFSAASTQAGEIQSLSCWEEEDSDLVRSQEC